MTLALRLVCRAGVLICCACSAPLVSLPEVRLPDGPLSLHAAMELALFNNPDVLAADARLASARASVDLAESSFWPSFQVGVSATRTDQPSQAFGSILDQGRFAPGIDFNDPGPVTNVRTGASFGLTLYDGGRRRAGVRVAEAREGSALAAAEQVRRDLALEVARAYYLVHKARETAATQRSSIANLQTHLRLVQARVDEGVARPSELLSVRVRLAETREAIIAADNTGLRALAALHVLLGLGLETPLDLLPPDDREPLTEAPPLRELLVRAYAHRPELMRVAQEIEAATAQLDAASVGGLPQIGVSAALTVDDPAALQGASHWLLGLGLVEDLIEAARTPMRVAQAAEALRAALADGRRVALAVELGAESARLDALEADARLAVTVETVALARESLSRVEAEYEGGVATITRLIDTEFALSQAATRASAARYDQALSRLALRHAVGEPMWSGASPSPDASQESEP